MSVDDILKGEHGLGYMGEVSSIRNPNQTDEYLNQVLKRSEELGIITLDTYRGINNTAKSLGKTREEFLGLIKNKKVGDIGSGDGGLAIECALNSVPVEIISVNPAIAHPKFKSDHQHLLQSKLKDKYSPEQITKAYERFESGAYAAIADSLPFENESLDIIIDINAVTFYSAKIGENVYRASLREMLRVLRPGGEILIGDSVHFLDPDAKSMQLQVIESLGVSYEYIYNPEETRYKIPIGIILRK